MSEKRYTEKNLVEDFSRITGQSLDTSRTYVMMVFEIIKARMRKGEPTVISNFAKFQTTKLKANTKVLNGKKVKVDAQYTPSVIFSKGYRNEIHACTEEIDQYRLEKKREEEREREFSERENGKD